MIDYFSSKSSKDREKEISSLLGNRILESESIKRLRKVSFLGVLNIAAGVPKHYRFTRYDHSISVAYLTWHYCQNMRLPVDVSLTATLLGLIHDIGHPPFSHSSEIYLEIRAGSKYKHTSVLTKDKIRKVLKEGFDSLPRVLKKEGQEALVNMLYNLFIRSEREKYHQDIVDIFDTPFCPDTFDGINRAWYALNTEDVKKRLGVDKITPLEVLNPIALVHFISSTTRPFLYKSTTPPTETNLIFRFHRLMRVLYNDIIYSPWQISAMVMFARALEIAYADVENLGFSHKNDDVFIKKIEKKFSSKKIYELILEGEHFYSLSEKNFALYKMALNVYDQAKRQRKSYIETKKIIETLIAAKLGIKAEFVFCHIDFPLIWSSDNVWFKEIPGQNRQSSFWLLKWDPSEGEPDAKPRIEIYYMESGV